MKSVQNIFNFIFSPSQAQELVNHQFDVFSQHMATFLSSISLVVILLAHQFILFSALHHFFILLMLIPQSVSLYSSRQGQTLKSIIITLLAWHFILFILSLHSIQLKLVSIMFLSTMIYKIHLATSSLHINVLNYGLCAVHLILQNLFIRFEEIEYYEYISTDGMSTFLITEALVICGCRYFYRPPVPGEKKTETQKENLNNDQAKSNEMRLNLIRIFVLGIKEFIQQIDEIINNEPEKSADGSTNKLKPLKHWSQNSVILLKNVIDLAKKSTESVENTNKVIDPVDFMHKVINFNQDILTSHNIHAQVFLSKSMPSFVRIDLPKFLQIITTLLLFSVKNSKKKGKILLFMAWADTAERRSLLFPFEESAFLRDNRQFLDSQSNQNTDQHRIQEGIRESFRLSECDVGFLDSDAHHKESLDSKKIKSIFEVNEFNKVIMKRFRLLEQTIYSPAQESRSFTSGFLKFELSDNSQSIPQEELAKILLLNPGHYDEGQASKPGLILWACKNLCQMMGGDIAVYSKPNQGNTIVFYFPAESNSLKLARLIPDRRIFKALIVDPDVLVSNNHKRLLEKEGIKAIITSTGNEALEKIIGKSEEAFDLAFIDSDLRDTSVMALAKEIRKYEQVYNRNTFMDLIFLRGSDEINPQLLSEFKNLEGHNIILKKPLDRNMLSGVLARLNNKSSDSSPNSKSDSNKGEVSFGVRNRVNQVQQTLRKAI